MPPGRLSPEVQRLRSPACIRRRCARVLDAVLRGESGYFEVDLARLNDAARLTAEVTRRRYPALRVPPHGRVQHFDAGCVPRFSRVEQALSSLETREQARRLSEIVVVSVLVDAGAGADWVYRDVEGPALARSEGLAVASLRWAEGGGLSSQGEAFHVDAARLMALTHVELAEAFQVRPDNPLVGLHGRVALLRALGEAVSRRPDLFIDGRVGGIVDALWQRSVGARVPAAQVLDVLLDGLSVIWPGRLERGGVPLGDVWPHPAAGGRGESAGLVPFHKLSQWLTYSLLDPLERAGLSVTGLEALTGLAEYRNGGLLIDTGVIVPRGAELLEQTHDATGALVVEWRALTVALLDRLLDPVRAELGVPAEAFGLAAMLEGGTWAAGRQIARKRRADGGPPLRIRSDGTVF